MDRLEEEVGVQLLLRGPTGVQTTLAGDIVYFHASIVRDEIQTMRRTLENGVETRSDSLRIGCLPSLSSSVIPRALDQWRTTFPDHGLRVVERVQIDLLSTLLRREIDVAFGVTDNYGLLDGLRQRVLYREYLGIVAQRDHPLFSKPNLEISDLIEFSWVIPPAGKFPTFLDQLLNSEGLTMTTQRIVCSSSSILKTMVAQGTHLALLPTHALGIDGADSTLSFLPVDWPQLHRSIAVFFRENYAMSEPEQKLIEQVQAQGQHILSLTRE